MRFTIDGVEVHFRKGQTIMEAARDAGIEIPALCAHEGLPPFGACRLCVVKVEGMKGFPSSCSTVAADGMVVHSDDEEVMRLRRNVMRLILTEHPHSCIVCNDREECERVRGEPEKAGRVTGCSMCPSRSTCEIRVLCDDLGMLEMDIPMEYKGLPLEREDPFFDRDYNLCILCGRCVRMCQQIQGVGAIALTNRSHATKVGTLFGRPHLEGPCRFCGACIDVCPTGALSARGSKWHVEPDTRIGSHCALCSLNCPLVLEEKWGKVMAAVPDLGRGGGSGVACVYGRFCIPPAVNGRQRLRYPLIRKGGTLAPVSWEEAFTFITESLAKYSPEDIGFLVSPALTNESAYLTQRLARDVVGSHNIDVLSPFGVVVMRYLAGREEAASAWAGLQEIEGADWLMLTKNDIVYSHPALAVAINRARERGATVLVVDDEKNELDVMAELTMRIGPGSLRAVLAALLKEVLQGHEDADLEGLEELRSSLEELTLKKAARLSNVPAERFKEVMRTLLSSRKGVIMVGSRILDDPEPDQVLAQVHDLLVLLDVEKGFMPLVEEGNVRGVVESGRLTGHRPGSRSGAVPALDHKGVMDGLGSGGIKALFLSEGSLPPGSVPEGTFLVLSEVYPTALDAIADVVLPSATFTEEGGHITSLGGREQELTKVVDPPGMAMPEWRIVAGLAKTMGADGFDHESVTAVHREMGADGIPAASEGRPYPATRELVRVKEPESLHRREHVPKGVLFRGTPLHELVGDLRIYLETRGRIPRTGIQESREEGVQ